MKKQIGGTLPQDHFEKRRRTKAIASSDAKPYRMRTCCTSNRCHLKVNSNIFKKSRSGKFVTTY